MLVNQPPPRQGEHLFKGLVRETRVVGPRETPLYLDGIEENVTKSAPQPMLNDTPDNIIKAFLTSE